ncbi:chemotaxis protein CheA [Terrisporobacter mayombei]|uniref:Chemotaxis protein CheA n=1 Tax=Terrisporobacter mayombei TaxID=1541 RepID=A0ABY9Q6G1_9FIRM|nr:chemotaxis protein CheA [Terrisporobacter mayombei]MCC3870342.1 chemotaxis protein CheA [Terrisporobacter mayombei]WMT83587.1 Chemotaxis protein CheA [Terrisporobacter mayombei]
MSGIDSMNEFYVQENMQLLEQLEEILLVDHSDTGGLAKEQIEEIFRAMHTIKGSSAMMGYDSLTTLTHCIEDVFDEIRKGLEVSAEKWEQIIDVVLLSIDFLKEEISNIQQGLLPESSIDELHDKVLNLLKDNEEDNDENTLDMDFNLVDEEMNQQTKEDNDEIELIGSEKKYCIKVLFEDGCGMEGIRALGVTTSIEDLCTINETIPADLMGDCDEEIIKDGFTMYVKTENDKPSLEKCLQETMFLKTLQITEISRASNKVEEIEEVNLKPDEEAEIATDTTEKEIEVVEKNIEISKINEDLKSDKDNAKEVEDNKKDKVTQTKKENKNSYLTVNIDKIDSLMNLVGEIVTTESMVEKQSQLENFDPDNFEKQARRLHQLTNELQDVVMSIRMVPISSTFTKMQRVVRDMSKKTGKKVDLVLIGEQTEVDKNILENISDPLMHMVRNSMDHGIETPEERKNTTKPEKATVTLEAKNTGGDILIIIKDDGRGLNKEAIVKKAIEKGVTSKSINEISDKEAYNFILAPGFSTKEAVTEYSGRGVGMDVVYTNIRKLRGSISIDSEYGKGTTFIIRIPLTLAIVDGMKIKNDDETYIIPSLNIKEVFRYGAYDIVENPNGEEHSIIRGNCYKICRLSKILGLSDFKKDDGIMILVESEMGNICLIVDSILGQQQVVIKPIPTILTQFRGVQSYLAGCSILEDGSISLILDVNAMIHR